MMNTCRFRIVILYCYSLFFIIFFQFFFCSLPIFVTILPKIWYNGGLDARSFEIDIILLFTIEIKIMKAARSITKCEPSRHTKYWKIEPILMRLWIGCLKKVRILFSHYNDCQRMTISRVGLSSQSIVPQTIIIWKLFDSVWCRKRFFSSSSYLLDSNWNIFSK